MTDRNDSTVSDSHKLCDHARQLFEAPPPREPRATLPCAHPACPEGSRGDRLVVAYTFDGREVLWSGDERVDGIVTQRFIYIRRRRVDGVFEWDFEGSEL